MKNRALILIGVVLVAILAIWGVLSIIQNPSGTTASLSQEPVHLESGEVYTWTSPSEIQVVFVSEVGVTLYPDNFDHLEFTDQNPEIDIIYVYLKDSYGFMGNEEVPYPNGHLGVTMYDRYNGVLQNIEVRIAVSAFTSFPQLYTRLDDVTEVTPLVDLNAVLIEELWHSFRGDHYEGDDELSMKVNLAYAQNPDFIIIRPDSLQ
ncbi:hypothetical protein JW710_03770 [Candidatus Dojkabacteria bacterium]|nr:hypothetical protein [Candidatus Dojkabacteria bacterium]